MRAWVEVVAWWVVLVLAWLGTVPTMSLQELITAAVLALPCAVAARLGRRAAGVRWNIRAGWARWLLGLPWAILHDTAAMLALACRGDRPEDDDFEKLPLPKESRVARRTGREALATAVLSATPGSVVVDAGGDLVVHTVPIGQTTLRRTVTR
jgi:multisubunit Na+/H+ antiporter MnhE subunit